jgi:AraC-like DNA-binding protein
MPAFISIGKIPAPLQSFPPHGHTTWEIVLYTVGRGIAQVGDERIGFKPGTIICMPPHIPHLENSDNGYTNIYIHTDTFPARSAVPVFQDDAERPFFQVATMLLREFHLKQPNWKLVTQDLFDVLLLYLNRWESQAAQHPIVERLKKIIILNLHSPEFDLQRAMDTLPMSADHLRKLFLQHTGQTPLNFLTARRIEEAKHLLAMQGYSIKEVAYRVGFSDPYYFSRVFSKTAGTSPSEFCATCDTRLKR